MRALDSSGLCSRILLLLVLSIPCVAAATSLRFELPEEGSDVVGALTWIEARHEDTLIALAREHGLGLHELVRANPDVDPWLPGEGTPILLPTRFVLPPGPRQGVVANLAEYRLYFFPPGQNHVITVPMGIGRAAFETPVLQTRVTDRIEQPSWTPPASVRAEYARRGIELARVVPAGPSNPLGEYALMLDAPGYLIHGTNETYGVGTRVSHGCLRLYPEHIAELVWKITVGTQVRIIHAPYKAGWDGDELVLEAHVPLSEFEADGMTVMVREVIASTGKDDLVDWLLAEQAAREQSGIPSAIGTRGQRISQEDSQEPVDVSRAGS